MRTKGTPRYAIELRSTPPPNEAWVTVQHTDGWLYRFVDRLEAEAELERLKTTQPHAVMRIRAM